MPVILESKVDSDGSEVALLELIICEPAKEGTLSDRAVADDDYLEQVVVLPDHVNNKSDKNRQLHESITLNLGRETFITVTPDLGT